MYEEYGDMLRNFSRLTDTGIMKEFPNDNESGYVYNWLCRIVYTSSDYSSGDEPEIEFYTLDTNQFVSSYYVDTILGTDGYGSGEGGLDLMGYVASWKIEAYDMEEIRNWLWDLKDRGDI